MAEGFETRQVIQSASPSGLANQPARTLGLVSVQAPRGGNMSRVGAQDRALAELTKLAGKEFEGYMENKRSEDEVKGQMMFQQGATEAELEKAGYDKSVLKGFQSMKLKTGFSQWYSKMSHDAKSKFADMDPDEYREQVLSPQFTEVLDGLDPNDALSRQMYTEFGKQGFSRLVESQSNMLFAEAQTGEGDLVQQSIDDFDEMTEGMSEGGKKEALLGAMIPHLNEGNFMIYDSVGGATGLRKRGYSPSEVETVQNAVKRAQVVRESTAGAQFDDSVDELMLMANEGRMGPTQALEQFESLQQEYRLSDEWVRGRVNEVRAMDFDRTLEDRELNILHDPDYTQDMAQLSILAEQSGNTADTTNAVLYIAEKYDLPRDMVTENLQLVRTAQDRKVNTSLNTIRRHNEKLALDQEKDIKAQSALRSGSLFGIDPETQQRAMKMKRQEIAQATEDPGERIDKHVNFLRSTPVIDQAVKGQFVEAGASSPVQDGKLSEASQDSLDYFLAMRQSGVSEDQIKKYAGNSYDYMNTAAFLQNGSVDPQSALLSAWEVTRTPVEERQTPRTKVSQVRKQVESDIDSFFDDIEPSMYASWFGAASDGKYDEVLTYEVKEAAENSDDMREWAVRRAEEYANIYPDMRPDAISDKVKRDLGRWEYVMGTMVPPTNGQSFKEMIGLDDMSEGLVSNTAVLSFINRYKNELLPEGSDQRTEWEQFTSSVGEGFGDLVLTPEKFFTNLTGNEYNRGENTFLSEAGQAGGAGATAGMLVAGPGGAIVGAAANVLLNTNESRQRRLKNLVPMDVTPYSNGMVLITMYHDTDKTKPMGSPIPVVAKDIGMDYKNMKRKAPFN
jgi:hypothetical protein